MQHVSLANTEILKTVGMTLNGDSVLDNDIHWAAVASSLNLTPKQQADSIILHDLYMRWTTRINAERHQYSCQLSVAMEATKYADTFRGIAYTGVEDGQQTNDVELMQKLHRTVVQDRWVCDIVGLLELSVALCLLTWFRSRGSELGHQSIKGTDGAIRQPLGRGLFLDPSRSAVFCPFSVQLLLPIIILTFPSERCRLRGCNPRLYIHRRDDCSTLTIELR